MLQKVFGKFTKWKVLKPLIFKDIEVLILGSIGIVAFISFFVVGVVAIQTALNMSNPLIPKNLIGYATRQSVILEFSPTFMSIIMAGKVGSYITSSIGTMRVTEQIDAKVLWLQLGIRDENAKILVEKNHIEYVENKCTKMEYQKYFLKVRQAFPVLSD